jgi:hypothetical protein
LKGSQVNFTNGMGRSTRLGNTITEGGFMNTSSCISCHARAAVVATGDEEDPLSVPLSSSVEFSLIVGIENSLVGALA